MYHITYLAKEFNKSWKWVWEDFYYYIYLNKYPLCSHSQPSSLAQGDHYIPRERERDMEETKSRFNRICVFCGSSSGKKASYQEAAVELGKELVTLKSLPPSLSLSLSLMDFIKSLSLKDQYFMEVHAFFNTFLNFYFFSDPFLIQNAIRVFYLCLLSLFW